MNLHCICKEYSMHKTRFSLKIHDSLKHISDCALEWSTKDQKFSTNKNYATNLAKEKFKYLHEKF